jgi:hypothetical protein
VAESQYVKTSSFTQRGEFINEARHGHGIGTDSAPVRRSNCKGTRV